MRTIFHLDLDAFFVSVERIIDPTLEGKPVIVGADPKQGRGVISACSYEARRYGLHSAMPIKMAYRLCPNGIYLHGHYQEYCRYSEAVKNILCRYAPVIEQASIDEFYMDFTGCEKLYGSFFMYASFLQKTIWKELSLPSSVGIGSNKTIAKIASDCMKPKGITYVIPGMEEEFLRRMPVETIPGVGKVTLRDLNAKGFYKIGDIAKAPLQYFSSCFGQCGTDLWEKAHGRGIEFLSPGHDRKSISKEHTYGQDVIDRKIIEQTLFNLVSKVCQGLRDEGLQTSTIGIKLRYTDFITLTRAKTIRPTSDDKEVYETVLQLFRKNHTRRVAVRLIGVHLSKLEEFSEQEFIFED
ncbi:MAG: DNA polymerase IV [Bacteroidota bacterium]|nr:DNA polymerase IV [Bacteroidota bacterium]